ncbi:RluA family pseudouridine synthase [Subdoligranulum variabile]|uniref:Pseudouridine synthase n=1 Tax=Subdoligranulum variabile DSM 15176 TaxID=411471 RepID=D1PL20_9FIRM|nr:RluA family pseudouridine synthase [Subdoligranulum variabile]EFB76678.1 pseudouridine synthase, RluA family [Subdoligranulum variabile DSM 15176]UWP68091.1 RluA family pseudouridine synthase [Subdoligranulum variabile]
MEPIEITAGPQTAGRLDAWLAGQCEGISRNALQTLIEQERVTKDGRPVNKKEKVCPGAVYLLQLPDPKPIEAVPQDIPLSIVYEDNDLIVVNKPKGMVVHPAPGNPDGTLVNALLYHCAGQLSGIGGAIRPGIVHRIDKDTSGLLVVAKNDVAHQALSSQMSVHSIHRVYHAIVYGNLKEDEGFVEAWLGRDPRDRKKMAVLSENTTGARYAYTGWRVLERFGNFTYIACKLKTGRTHQIRVHMASIGHPLAGDVVYGPRNCIKSLAGQCLHAKELGFVHPSTENWMQFDSPLPAYFTDFLNRLRKEHRA